MQIGRTVLLSEIIAKMGVERTQQFLQQKFKCEKNPDIEHFLLNSAIRFEQAKIARTYLIFSESADVLAYFSLSFKSIKVNTSKNQLKKLTGGLTNSQEINVFLIGQIGKNSQIQENIVNLSVILDEVFSQIKVAQSVIGGKVVILECEDKPKLIHLYEQYGFRLLNTEEDEYHLKTMYIIPKFE